MKWTHYPTEKDKKNRENGVTVTGTLWADAPGPGNQYVLPNGAPPSSHNLVIVQTLRDRATSTGKLPEGTVRDG